MAPIWAGRAAHWGCRGVQRNVSLIEDFLPTNARSCHVLGMKGKRKPPGWLGNWIGNRIASPKHPDVRVPDDDDVDEEAEFARLEGGMLALRRKRLH